MKAALPVFAATLALAPLAHAATVYTSGHFDSSFSGYYSDPGVPQWSASQITLPSDIICTSLQVEGFYNNGTRGTDQFSLAIFADNGSSIPATLMQNYSGGDITLSSTVTNDSVYQYTLSLSSAISLQAGTYWLSVVNDSTGGNWAWATSAGSADPLASTTTSQTSGYARYYGYALIFSLEGTVVPEPSTLALGGLSLGLLLRRKRR